MFFSDANGFITLMPCINELYLFSFFQVPPGTYSLCKVFQKEALLLHSNWMTSLKGGGTLTDLNALRVRKRTVHWKVAMWCKKWYDLYKSIHIFDMFTFMNCSCSQISADSEYREIFGKVAMLYKKMIQYVKMVYILNHDFFIFINSYRCSPHVLSSLRVWGNAVHSKVALLYASLAKIMQWLTWKELKS